MVTMAAQADQTANQPLSPLNAIRRAFAAKYPNLKDPIRVVSMQQAGNTILAAIGIGDTGSYLVLKRDPKTGGWMVVSGGGGAIATAQAEKSKLSESDVANFTTGRSQLIVPSPGFKLAPASVTAKATMLITPRENIVIHPTTDLQRQNIPPRR